MSDDIKRIGRPANPAERGLQLALERPELLEHMAENLYLDRADEYTLETAERFRALPDEERAKWRALVLESQRKHAAEYVPPTDPDDPDPGATRPTEIHRVA